NDLLRPENDKVKQHYKEFKAKVQPPVLTRTKHAVDVEPIVPRLRNNRDARLDYLRHLKESVETIRDIVEEAKVLANTPLIRKKQVTIAKPFDKQDSNKQVHVVAVKPQKTNVPVPPSTGVTSYPKASGSQPKSNPKTNRISPAKGIDNDIYSKVDACPNACEMWKAIERLKQEAVATACYTQNRSLIHTRHHKTPYELVHNKKPGLTFFRVFSARCYPTNDSEDLRKLQPTADTGIFVGYAPSRKGYRIYNKRTRRIMETIHV
nr:integrase, catalytic region, zinc finger, CCHC-type, peptidase aspartic, catalytic [Tanacetum cinerariifolium]